MRILILIACWLLATLSVQAQPNDCRQLTLSISSVRNGSEEITQQADPSVRSAVDMLKQISPCLAADKKSWHYSVDTLDGQVLCQLYSSDSLYGLLGFENGLNSKLVLKLKKLNGPNPINYAPLSWKKIMHADAGKSSQVILGSDLVFDTDRSSKDPKYCSILSTLLSEAQVNFKNISLAYRHNATYNQNYSSEVTIQQNPDNNYILADGQHRFIRYTEIINDRMFFDLVKTCMQELSISNGWKKTSSPGSTKYTKGSVELLLKQDPNKNKSAITILIITKKLAN